MLSSVITYFKEAKAEIKKVTWPTKKTVQRFTVLVIVISIAIAIFLGALDTVFGWALETFVL
jgi:preprotein translocase subunit SecE